MLRTLQITVIALLVLPILAFGENDPQKKYTRAEYIATWKDVAIQQMKDHGIPASITLAQGILESGDGNSKLAREANNHFGIKCHDWTGKKVYHDDDARNECFRKYRTAHESFEDHSIFLKRSRYAFLFDYKVTDYKSWAKGLKQAGYATNPKYPDLLIRIIEENNLTAYDLQGLDKKGKKPTSTPNTSGDEIVIDLNRGTEVYMSDNRIKYVITETDHTPKSLSKALDLGPWQIGKYNDLDKDARIPAGSKIYIQPKRNKAANVKTHTVQKGETLRIISQEYGVKIKKIAKRSGIEENSILQPGQVLKLR
jgi:LysM repeat protein